MKSTIQYIFLFSMIFISLIWSNSTRAGIVELASSENLLNLKYNRLVEMQSVKGEGEVAFLKRVGVWMTGYSKEHGTEVCGTLSEKYVSESPTSGYVLTGVVLTTSNSNLVCMEQPIAPSGFSVVARTIHNHGYWSSFRPNAVDERVTDRKVLRGQHVDFGRTQDRFSGVDMEKEGYLATHTNLLYENGKGAVIDYGSYDTPFDYSQISKKCSQVIIGDESLCESKPK